MWQTVKITCMTNSDKLQFDVWQTPVRCATTNFWQTHEHFTEIKSPGHKILNGMPVKLFPVFFLFSIIKNIGFVSLRPHNYPSNKLSKSSIALPFFFSRLLLSFSSSHRLLSLPILSLSLSHFVTWHTHTTHTWVHAHHIRMSTHTHAPHIYKFTYTHTCIHTHTSCNVIQKTKKTQQQKKHQMRYMTCQTEMRTGQVLSLCLLSEALLPAVCTSCWKAGKGMWGGGCTTEYISWWLCSSCNRHRHTKLYLQPQAEHRTTYFLQHGIQSLNLDQSKHTQELSKQGD